MIALSERAVREGAIFMFQFLTAPESCCIFVRAEAMRDTRTTCWGEYDDAAQRLLGVGGANEVETKMSWYARRKAGGQL